MRTTCPTCKKRYDVSLNELLEYIKTNEKFRAKALRLIKKVEQEERAERYRSNHK